MPLKRIYAQRNLPSIKMLDFQKQSSSILTQIPVKTIPNIFIKLLHFIIMQSLSVFKLNNEKYIYSKNFLLSSNLITFISLLNNL